MGGWIESLHSKMELVVWGLGMHSVSQLFVCRAYSRIGFWFIESQFEIEVILGFIYKVIMGTSCSYLELFLKLHDTT